MSPRRITRLVSAALAAAWLAPAAALSQSYPERPVSLVVGQAAGGTSDVLARFFADALGQRFGRVIVENTTGAGGTIAATRVARAAPDGYTLLFGSSGINAIAYSLYKELAYKPEDLVPVGQVTDTSIVVAVKKGLGVRTMAEFVALARSKPDELTMGHTGNGQTTHLVCVLLQQTTGIRLRMVPFRGGGDSVNALLGGVVDGACNGIPDLAQNVLSGSVVGLGVATADRKELIPDTPSAIDLGLPGLVAPVWLTIFAPKGTPRPIVDKLNAALQEAMADPDLARRLAAVGSSIPPKPERSVEAAERLVASEIRRWAEVMQQAGVGKSQ